MEQKSAPVTVAVIGYIAGHSSTAGLLIIPCLIGKLAQIFIGSALVPRLATWVEAGSQQPRKAAKSTLRSEGGETSPPTPPQEMKDFEATDDDEESGSHRKFVVHREFEQNKEFTLTREFALAQEFEPHQEFALNEEFAPGRDFERKQELAVNEELVPRQERELNMREALPESRRTPQAYSPHGAIRAGSSGARQQETFDELEALEVGAGECGWASMAPGIRGARGGRESDETDGPSTEERAVRGIGAEHHWEWNGAV
jgi:hypothetical protein